MKHIWLVDMLCTLARTKMIIAADHTVVVLVNAAFVRYVEKRICSVHMC
jgi:hypothetical protein